jgi:hypothetical protein
MRGFEFRETMAGSFHLDPPHGDGRARPFSFTVRARSRGLVSFLRNREVTLEGAVEAEGLADHRPIRGTLGLDPLRTGTLPYALEFTDNDGRPYRFVGKKTLTPGDPVQSMTVLPGVLVGPDGVEVGKALLRFDLRSDLGRFLASFRLQPV